jgi:hypothetical protein
MKMGRRIMDKSLAKAEELIGEAIAVLEEQKGGMTTDTVQHLQKAKESIRILSAVEEYGEIESWGWSNE